MTAPLSGLRFGLTAGPTRVWIDSVRYISNASSGHLGALIADQLVSMGARVDALWGRGATYEPLSPSVTLTPVESPEDLLKALELRSAEHKTTPYAAWIHAMAVLDYVPRETYNGKIDSGADTWTVDFIPTPKVIQQIKPLFPGAQLIGFKLLAEDDLDVLRKAAEKLESEAGCDLVVANPAPFRDPASHQAYLLQHTPRRWWGPCVGKVQVAQAVVDWIVANRN